MSNQRSSKVTGQGWESEVVGLQQEISSLKAEVQDLRQKEEKYSKAFNENQVALIIIRLKDSVVVDVNETCLGFLGYQREEMIGKSLLELNTWSDLAEREEIMNQISKVGSVRNLECRIRKKRGEIMVALLSSTIIDLDGLKHMLTSGIDITERKKNEEALRNAYEILQSEQPFGSGHL